MHTTEGQKASYPACVIAFLIALSFGIVTICQLYLLKDNYPVSKLKIGSDYACFYLGTELLMEGFSPYAIKWYQFPPIPAFLNYPLWLFDVATASRLIFFILIAAIVSAYALMKNSFEWEDRKDGARILLCGFIIILLSYPFYFLIARGHMLGIVIMLLAMGLYLLKRNNPASGICFGLSISMIVFPVLLLAPLLLFRRYKIFICSLLSLLLLVLFCPDLWFEYFVTSFVTRLHGEGWYMVEQNCSLTNTILFFAIFINKALSPAGLPVIGTAYCYFVSHSVNLIIFLTMAIADFQIRKNCRLRDTEIETALTLMYVPLMLTVPTVSFQYGLVLIMLLIPALCSLVQKLKQPMPKIILWIFIAGIFLSQIQAHSLQKLLNPKYELFHFFPALGLFLVLLGCVSFKLWMWRHSRRESS